MYEIYVRQAIEAGLADSDAGRTLHVKEVRAKFESYRRDQTHSTRSAPGAPCSFASIPGTNQAGPVSTNELATHLNDMNGVFSSRIQNL